ncbi:hypothetical protein TGMAS_259610 [Toxoplasma gondii MAS]|uniref:Uncharacterized protein n=1 Tax=Toxoplasma gondii MAS TaxID=943118 RepID=A0A086QRD8_TOXGO|nr:hypothetical protein TGMAS_259610 [Toxoplasma gondii MAS]
MAEERQPVSSKAPGRLTRREAVELSSRMQTWIRSTRYEPTSYEINEFASCWMKTVASGGLVGMLATTAFRRNLGTQLATFLIGSTIGSTLISPTHQRRQWENIMERPGSELGRAAKSVLSELRGSGDYRSIASPNRMNFSGPLRHDMLPDSGRYSAKAVAPVLAQRPEEPKRTTVVVQRSSEPATARLERQLTSLGESDPERNLSARDYEGSLEGEPGTQLSSKENSLEEVHSAQNGWHIPNASDAWQPVNLGQNSADRAETESTKPELLHVAAAPTYRTWDEIRSEAMSGRRHSNTWDELRAKLQHSSISPPTATGGTEHRI